LEDADAEANYATTVAADSLTRQSHIGAARRRETAKAISQHDVRA